MSANLSTVEHYGTGFDRSGFPFAGILLNETDKWSEEEFEAGISQVPEDQLPLRLRHQSWVPKEAISNGLALRPPSEVLEAWIKAGSFDGLVLITDSTFVFPPQHFTVSSREGSVILESQPTDPWPQILIELTPSSDGVPAVQKFSFRPSGNTVYAEILYTRALHTVSDKGSCLIASEVTSVGQVIGISFSFQPLSREDGFSNLYRAKIARKLKFIESVFKLSLTLPENITPNHVQYIETIFRGLTEGEFISRGSGITIFLKGTDIDTSNPPFSEPGSFEHYSGTEQALLYPQVLLDVGPYYTILTRAVIANQRNVTPLREGKSLWVRFEVLDGQITYRYERYTHPDAHKRIQQKLKQFHSQLVAEESQALAETLLQPLILDVPRDEAIKIAVGWLEYHNFPDRFSPQEPILDEGRACWQLPIYIVYANGKGAPVGELLIDLKKGSIIDEPSPELMYQEGLALGEKILRVV
jgi:hypothetical protein